MRGAPGIGKSALLEYAERTATGLRVLRASGVESEMALPYAALHQLCMPLLERRRNLPDLQCEALETVFGLRSGPAPERFLVGLSVLSLLSDASEDGPQLCVVDDAHWLDRESAQILGIVARRLLAESVALFFGSRERPADLIGLPELEITGLRDADAATLLDSVTSVRLDPRVRERFVAEARGNPLALLELPRVLTVTQMAGEFGLPHADGLPDRIEQGFQARIDGLPEQARLLLLVAAAEPTGDPMLVRRCAERLGIASPSDLAGEMDGLLTFGVRVVFRHPLVRSAVYGSANRRDLRTVHLALAEAVDGVADPDRRAWHLAAAAFAPDESVAAELERSAGRVRARGGPAAAAAFLQRSVALTSDGSLRAERALLAADATFLAGGLEVARDLIDVAERHAREEFQRVRAHLLRSHIVFASGLDDKGPLMLLSAARRLEPFDRDLARRTYLLAWGSAAYGATNRDSMLRISRAMRELPLPENAPSALDLIVRAFALLITDDRAAALPYLRRALAALPAHPPEDLMKWGWAAFGLTAFLWEDAIMTETPARMIEIVRAAGVMSDLPIYLHALGVPVTMTGDFAAAASIAVQADSATAVTGMPIAQHTRLLLAGMRGREEEAVPLITTTIEESVASGQLNGVSSAQWAASILYNGLARYEPALSAARATLQSANALTSQWALPELIEAAARTGDHASAHGALSDLAEAAEPCDTDWAQGILTRCQALTSDGGDADGLYRQAIDRLGRTTLRPELARAHLLYGEWLRRDRQRTEARTHLRTAHEMFSSIGMEAFAERARRELLATGETVRKRKGPVPAAAELTAQELQIALLARDGLSNPEVGSRLFLSPRTVEWHLRKIFTKLEISSRRQLSQVLPRDEDGTSG
ncbi:LuxR family transcriptional regulator [Actinocorallia longicatena]|uniref:LuxR family transcriptional regulator n=1 Tax=Actinocorallia longicatena TaxID=111803 RepID=A0ABP6Q718_9ACTN